MASSVVNCGSMEHQYVWKGRLRRAHHDPARPRLRCKDSGSSFQPSSRQMEILQRDEHTFYWGQPPVRGTSATHPPAHSATPASGSVPSPTISNTSAAAPGATTAHHTTTPAAASAETSSGRGADMPSPPAVPLLIDVPSARVHSLAATTSVPELLQGLYELLETAAPAASSGTAGGGERGGADRLQCPGREGGGCGGSGHPGQAPSGAVLLLLPVRVADLALSKTAGWVLEPGSNIGTAPSDVAATLALLQPQIAANAANSPASTNPLAPDTLASLLWSTASILGAYGWAPHPHLVPAVQIWLQAPASAAVLAGPPGPGVATLVSLLWGYAALREAAAAAGAGGEGDFQNFEGGVLARGAGGDGGGEGAVDVLMEALTAALTAGEGGGGRPVAAAGELADAAWALSVIGRRSPAAARLAESLAHELYRQLSNRSSLQTSASPQELVKIVGAYAELGLRDGSVARMFDAVGGHVAKRIRNRHIHALTRPGDCAALLEGFADAGHTSVVVPELLAACALQISREVAAHNDLLHAVQPPQPQTTTATSNPTDTSTSSSAGGSATRRSAVISRFLRPHSPIWHHQQRSSASEAFWHWSTFLPLPTIIAILASYTRLGYYPGPLLVDSLLLAAVPQLLYAAAGQISELLLLLAAVRHVPGSEVCIA